MQITFRRAINADLDFLDDLHTACMQQHVKRVYSWNPQLFRQTFNPQFIEIILLNQVVVGMVQIVKKHKEIYLANLLVSPNFQNLGIGSLVLKKLIKQAETLQMPVTLQVLKKNPAKRLYERFGFMVIQKTSTHYIMKRTNQINLVKE